MEGKTTPKQGAQAKHWCFTLNNPTLKSQVITEGYDYLVVGYEKGKEGTPHYQGYVCFTKQKRLTAVKKLMPTAHWEISRGTPQQAADYCKKDGSYEEDGALPLTGPQKTKRNWDEAFELAKAGKLEEIPKNILMPYYNCCKRIKQDYPSKPPTLNSLENTWLWGPPGIGKSKRAREELGDSLYDKPLNKWWDGYRDEQNILLDDFSKVHNVLGHHLKRWADHYSFPAEQKGTTIQIRPKKIYVTSNYHPLAIFIDDPTQLEAITRRFNIIEMKPTIAIDMDTDTQEDLALGSKDNPTCKTYKFFGQY